MNRYFFRGTILSFFIAFLWTGNLTADPGDTLVVQTYTFEEQNNPDTDYDSPGRRWFTFPEDDGTTYQKILMYYTLKCFEDGTAGGLGFPCGEWDYLTYNYLYDHTGELDSNLLSHPQYLFNNLDFEMQEYIESPLYNTLQITYQEIEDITYDTFDQYTQLDDGTQSQEIVRTDAQRSRVQFLYTAAELQAMGMESGNIWGMELDLGENYNASDLIRVRMAAVNDEVTEWYTGAMTSVHTGPFSPENDGWWTMPFTEPFLWNGESNILFEISGRTAEPAGMTDVKTLTSSTVTLSASGADRYVAFNNADKVDVPSAAFADLQDEVTVSFWVYGDEDIQPSNSTVFEGVNADNQRVLNSHLPWGNGRVYWDAGQSGGYDRIDKQANNVDYEGRWNHWAFTKNAVTGEMHIYLNGELWHSGTDRFRTMEGIVKFSIGAAAGWSNYYNGKVDEFRVWKTALDQETIQTWMGMTLDDSHPQYDDLLVYYDFNEMNGEPVIDHSGNGYNGVLQGSPERALHHEQTLFMNTVQSDRKPAVRVNQGTNVVISTVDMTYEEPVMIPPVSLTTYEVSGYDVEITDIDYVWEVQETYVLNEEGEIVATLPYEGETQEITNTVLEYYGAPFEVIDRYEIGRFITPYGIGLDLDEDGWTWVFDVTDYEPLLHGEVELEAGNWQELLDMKFLFIEGTPTREVKRVEAFWKGTYNLNNFDALVTDHTIVKEDGEEGYRLKTRASGHGFGQGNNCGEFCYNTHKVKVNGETQWTWEIMQECADNPLFPQGGTWIYDRAGWCPGDKVKTQNFELTDLVSGGDEFTVDYDIDYDPDGNYRFEGQVIAYGAPNFATDVELVEILAPSKWKIRSRMNPICDDPIIRIRNNGTETLTSVNISYGVGGVMNSYTWTGELGFLETADVQLSYDNPGLWQGDEEEEMTFEVELTGANGSVDENAFNNYGTSQFIRPPLYTYGEDDDNRIIVWTKTNNAPWETTVSIETMNGTPVYYRDDFNEANENYRDTIALNAGCYKYIISDSGEDGLSFFANNDGNGTARLKKVAGSTFVNFEPDFGKEIVHYFRFETDLVTVEEETKVPTFDVYPNPGGEYFFISLKDQVESVNWYLYDMNGRVVEAEENDIPMNDRIMVNTAQLPAGMYSVVVEIDGIPVSRRWVK